MLVIECEAHVRDHRLDLGEDVGPGFRAQHPLL